MSNGINLISKENVGGSKKERIKKLQNFSYLLLLIIAFLAISVFLINYKFSANAIRGEQEKLLVELTSYDETVVKTFLLENRISDITNIITKRKKYNDQIKEITNNSSASLTIDEFKIENSEMLIGVSSNSLEDLNDFLNHFLSLSEKKVISNVVLEELSLRASLYNMKIAANSL